MKVVWFIYFNIYFILSINLYNLLLINIFISFFSIFFGLKLFFATKFIKES